MKILICGIGGRMGKAVLTEAIKAGHNVVCGVDAFANTSAFPCPVYKDFEAVKEIPDCVIDFSTHTAVRGLLPFCEKHNIPVVLATTGFDAEEEGIIKEAAKKIAIFRSGNMSVGVYVLQQLTKLAAKLLPNANIEIIEQHHNQKIDAPSGTALMLAESAKNGRDMSLVCGREGLVGKRTDTEIGMHSVRGGTVVGKHDVMLMMGQEVITLRHEAESRTVFALGSIRAAEYMVTLSQPGIYNMSDMLK